MAESYNYAHFPADMDQAVFDGFPAVLRVGQRAPDGELTRLSDGAHVRLSEYWRERPLLIEFGSLT